MLRYIVVIFISFIIFSGEMNVDRGFYIRAYISGKKKIYLMFQKFLTSCMAFSYNVFLKFHIGPRT